MTILIVGAGLSGCVLAEQFATRLNKQVLVIEKRDHIGGNCYDYIDENGILVSKYGAHLFHTDYEDVWSYVNQFSEWCRWDHRVVCSVDDKLVPMPVNINTVNAICGENIKTPAEMDKWLNNIQEKPSDTPKNGEEMAKSRVGNMLYEKLFKEYTFKQWSKYPSELLPEVLARIPVRNNHDDRYFTDKYQALPKHGYTKFVESLINHHNITVKTSVDYFDLSGSNFETVIYTGPIDAYFKNIIGEKLEYRSIKFVKEDYKNMEGYYQSNSVVNYPGTDVEFTRIVEYKHFLNQKSPHTTIVKEYSTDEGEPYYPVLNAKNLAIYEKYKKLAEGEKNVHFIGRLANYKYFNMDQAIKNALDYFNNNFV